MVLSTPQDKELLDSLAYLVAHNWASYHRRMVDDKSLSGIVWC